MPHVSIYFPPPNSGAAEIMVFERNATDTELEAALNSQPEADPVAAYWEEVN